MYNIPLHAAIYHLGVLFVRSEVCATICRYRLVVVHKRGRAGLSEYLGLFKSELMLFALAIATGNNVYCWE